MSMCASVHIEIIKKRIVNDLPFVASAAIDRLHHTFCQKTLNELDASVGMIAFYQQWMLAMHSQKRIRVVGERERARYMFPNDSEYIDYILAGYFGRQIHVLAGEVIGPAQKRVFDEFGIECISPSGVSALRCDANPIHEMVLTAETRVHPRAIGSYFAKERRVFVYDKFLNKYSAIALGVYAAFLEEGAAVVVMTAQDKVGDGGALCRNAMLDANASLRVEVVAAHGETTRNIHDRHVFIGSRYHLRFTAGLDVFGPVIGGVFRNGEGAIYINDVFENFRPLSFVDTTGAHYHQRVSLT